MLIESDMARTQELPREYFSEFAGRGVVIAGGGQGIGAALVRAFHGLGARVAILDKNAADAQAVAARCGGGHAPIPLGADLSEEDGRAGALAALEKALGGSVAAFVSTIGLDSRIALDRLTQAEADRLMRVNFYAPFFTARDMIPLMRKSGGGAICLFTSRHGSEIFAPDMTGYGCAKAALDSGIKRLARFAGESNTAENVIRVFGFCPGWVQTENQKARFTPDQFRSAAREQLVPRDMRPEDIVPPVLFALSSHARLFSGATLRFDGGEGQIEAGAVADASKEAAG